MLNNHLARLRATPYLILAATYALVVFSTPMPAHIGWVEAVMGVGLLLSCGLLMHEIYKRDIGARRSFILVLAVASYVVIAPLLVGVLSGHEPRDVIRDLAPALFLMIIPIVVRYSLTVENVASVLRVLLLAVLFVGVVSALHSLIWVDRTYGSFQNFMALMAGNFEMAGMSQSVDNGPSDFQSIALLVYEPAVLFTAVYALLTVIEGLFAGELMLAVLWLIPSLLCVYVLSIWGARAPVLLVFFGALFFVLRRVKFTVRTVVGMLLVLAGMSVLVSVMFADTVKMMLIKQHAVGFNGKTEEFLAVLEQSKSSAFSFFLGSGWGGLFNNPIYLSAPTRYTHSLISFLLLKTGVLGLAAFLWVYFSAFLKTGVSLLRMQGAWYVYKLQLASLLALLIGLAIQPSFKMLGFSVMLAVLYICATDDFSEVGVEERCI